MFKFIEKGPERGDCTAPYKIELDKKYTVLTFIQEVLRNKPNEWGYIGIKSHDPDGLFFGKPRIEYRGGEVLGGIENMPIYFVELLTTNVKSASADGGWTRMDYLLEVTE